MRRHYLLEMKFELRIDHHELQYLFEQQNLNARKVRCLQFLCEFDFDIKHVKGKENKVVDALSRRMHVMHVATINTCNSDLKSRILEALSLDDYYLHVKEKLQQGDAKQNYKDFRLEEDGILMHINKVYVPDFCETRKFTLKEIHNVPYVGHQGYKKTLE